MMPARQPPWMFCKQILGRPWPLSLDRATGGPTAKRLFSAGKRQRRLIQVLRPTLIGNTLRLRLVRPAGEIINREDMVRFTIVLPEMDPPSLLPKQVNLRIDCLRVGCLVPFPVCFQ